MDWTSFEDDIPVSAVELTPIVLVDKQGLLYDGRVRRGVIAYKRYGMYNTDGYEYINMLDAERRFTHWMIIKLPQE